MDKKVVEINQVLLQGEPGNVQVKKALSERGRTLYGYIPQAIFNAVNKVLGPGNFKSEVKDVQALEKQVVARVVVGLRLNDKYPDEWTGHEQAGEMGIVFGDVGSAMKGAITDATEKSLGAFSVGERAYRGKLDPRKQDQKDRADTLEVKVAGLKDKSQARRFYKQHCAEIKALDPETRAKIVSKLSAIGGNDGNKDK